MQRAGPIRKSLGDILWVSGPKLGGAVAQLAFNVLLLRFLSPNDYGTVSVCLSGILLLDAVFGAALDMGILRLAPAHLAQGRVAQALGVQQAGLLVKPLCALVLGIVVLLDPSALSRFLFQSDERGGLILLSIAALLGLQVLRSVQAHFQVEQRFVLYGIADLLHNVLRFGGIAFLLALGAPSMSGILSCYAIAPLLISATLLFTAARALVSSGPMRSGLRELASVVAWYLPTVVLGSILSRIDLFMVTRLAGVDEAGIFSAAQAIIVAPQLLGTYVAVVFGPRIMPKYEAGTLWAFYRKIQLALLAAGAVLFVGAWFSIGPLSALLLPESYQRSTGLLLLLLPSTLAALVNFPLCISVLLFLRPKAILGFHLVTVTPLVLAYWYAIGHHGARGAAVVTTAYALLQTAYLQGLAWRILSRAKQHEHGASGTTDGALPTDAAPDARVRPSSPIS